MLRSHGHEIVFTADNPKGALEALRRKENAELYGVDCMIIDYKTKNDDDGLDSIGVVAAEIAGSNPSMNIIFVSTDVSIEREVKSLGFEYLRKPFAATELLDLLNRRKGAVGS